MELKLDHLFFFMPYNFASTKGYFAKILGRNVQCQGFSFQKEKISADHIPGMKVFFEECSELSQL